MSLSSEKKMDQINSSLGRLLLEEITPVVMVLSTPLAEEACLKNGLNFVQMLLPFSLFDKIDVPVRTASDQPYRLQMFKLRLVYASDVHLPNYQVAEEHLKQVVSESGDKIQVGSPSNTEPEMKKSESYQHPSWIQTFNKELMRSLSFSEHEAFDHPVACLMVVSSRDQQPINRFVDLFNPDQLPSLLNEGVMDPKILKHYLLLHDNQDGTSEKATNILAEMRNTFGSNDCKLLCINSAQGVVDELNDNPSVPSKNHASLGQSSTCFLNTDDLDGIREFLQDLSSNHVIPYMEQKIRILNQQVSATRKGFKNQIKNLWWRKGKEDPPETLGDQMYTFSSIESQIRVLGDYAFILRDYELALSNYRLLSTDYKLDKAWKRYAGVQEMMGLSFFMLDHSRKEAEYCMENAFSTYLKSGSCQRNATRCGLWWAEMLKGRYQYKDAATVYFRISNEEPPLHAAVLLEQASYCYLLSSPPMLRKFGFHLVLAGNNYYISHQRDHAIRAYTSCLSIYEGNSWSYINDQVHFNIGRWYAFLGMFDVAVKHMLEVLECSHLSLTTQDLFLSEFFRTVQNMGKIPEVCKLPLPVINMSSLNVIYEDHRTYASSADVGVSESLWQSLEEDMVPSISTFRSNWLESNPNFSLLKKKNESHVCILGEAIKVNLEVRNPLQISISVSGVSLICELSVKSETTKSDGSASSAVVQDDVELTEAPSCRNCNNDVSSLTLSEADFVLEGGETKRVQLDVTPKVEGVLKLVGVRWILSGSVISYQNFDFGKKKKKQRKGKKGTKRSSFDNLNFVVIKGLPKLEGGFQMMPRKVYAGDLRLLKLELRNQSEYSAKNMKMKISHPSLFIPGNLEHLSMDFPCCLEKQENPESKYVPSNTTQKSKSLLFSFPNDATIQGGTTFHWPFWFNTGLHGKVSLYISIYYEMENCSSDMSYRTLRMHYDLEVLPSLDASFLINPCPSSLQEFLVQMDIVNKTSSESFYIHQLSCVSDQWEISLLPAVGSMQMVSAAQALSFFFKLKESSSNLDYSSHHAVAANGSDVLLGTQGRTNILIDTSKSPIADFHNRERFQQRKSPEGGTCTVDFVVISMLGDESDTERSSDPQLLSHHACHCSITSKDPIWWLMDGPRTILHDFNNSFCEATLHLTIRNCSWSAVSVRVATFDAAPHLQPSVSSGGDSGGWHEIPLASDIKSSETDGGQLGKLTSPSVTPFIWCASSSTKHTLVPDSSVEVPLRVCVFSPGTYDLSSYELQWMVEPSVGGAATDVKGSSMSGSSRGYPFYLTVLQSPL